MNEKFKEEYGEIEKVRIHEGGDPVTRRPAEVDAVNQMVNPKLPDAFSAERAHAELVRENKALHQYECTKCHDFKPVRDFSYNEECPEREYCHSWCKDCVSTYVQTKRQIIRNGQRSEGYRYKARKEKKARRRK